MSDNERNRRAPELFTDRFTDQGTETLSAQRANGNYDGDYDELTELEHEDIGVVRGDGDRPSRWKAPMTLAPAQEHAAQQQAAQQQSPPPPRQPQQPQRPHQNGAPVFVGPTAAPSGATVAGPPRPSNEQPAVPAGATATVGAVPPAPAQQPTQQMGYAGPPPTSYPPQGGAFPGGPEVGEPMPSRAARAPRRARLTLRHLDPLSMLKFSLVLAAALFVVWMVAVGVLYGVLSGMGVFDKINSTANEINGSTGDVVTPGIVFGAAAVVGAINIVLFTAFATIGSFIYNLCADMVGGLEVTLAERD